MPFQIDRLPELPPGTLAVFNRTARADRVIGEMIANGYLTLINQLTGKDIALFTDQEILATAGLSS